MRRHVLLTVVLSVLATALVASPAGAATGAAVVVTGRVTDDSSGRGLQGLTVTAHDDRLSPAVATTTTDERGAFSLDLPDDVEYLVTASDPTGRYGSTSRWFRSGDGELELRLTERTGLVSGSVRDQYGVGIPVKVRLRPEDGTEDLVLDTWQNDEDHDFSVRVRPGRYRVALLGSFDGPDERWIGGTDAASATVLTVTADETLALGDHVVDVSGYLAGTVTDEAGRPLRNVGVRPYFRVGDRWRTTDRFWLTGPDGTYRTARLSAFDDVRIEFVDRAGTYLTQWYGGGSDLANATPVSTTEGSRTGGLDVRLLPGPPAPVGRLHGTLVDVDGAPAKPVQVWAYREDASRAAAPAYRTTSRRDGTYAFATIEPGRYVLSFAYGSTDHVPALQDGATSRTTAPRVTVVDYGSTTVPVQRLRSYGSVDVPVQQRDGLEDLEDHDGLLVEVLDLDGRVVTSTDASGSIRVEPGRYRVRAAARLRDDHGRTRYVGTRWNGGALSEQAARPFTVPDGGTVTLRSITLDRQLVATTAPRVSGTARRGKVLTASTGTWAPGRGLRTSVQWYRGTRAIKGATRTSYRVTSADVGAALRVRVSVRDPRGDYLTSAAWSGRTRTVTR